MIPKGLFTQIVMVVVAVAIIITYVQPAFSDIGAVQDDIAVYREEREKVISVNSQLATLVSQLESVSRDDRAKLERYMPDPRDFDEIAVSRDLVLITLQSGVFFNSVEDQGRADQPNDSEDGETLPRGHRYALSVEGTYDQIKNLFQLMEQNNYPLEVHELRVQQVDGGFLEATMQIVTYEFNQTTPDGEIIF